MSHPEGANSSSSSGWANVPYAAEVSGFISGQKEEVEEKWRRQEDANMQIAIALVAHGQPLGLYAAAAAVVCSSKNAGNVAQHLHACAARSCCCCCCARLA
jgi:hypothetical protein